MGIVAGRHRWPTDLVQGARSESAYAPGETIAYDFDAGTLHVQSVTRYRSGVVVDCGGYVVPDGHTSTLDVVAAEPRTRLFLSRVLSRDC